MATITVSGKVELRDEEDNFGTFRIEMEFDVEVGHAFPEVDRELARDIVRNNETPPLRMSTSDSVQESVPDIDISYG